MTRLLAKCFGPTLVWLVWEFCACFPNAAVRDEIHEWQDRFKFPPTVTGEPGGERLTDPFTGADEVLESGQNNQGWGELIVHTPGPVHPR